MFIIVGLGNPGSKYSKTRHNAGFLFLDYLYNEFNGKALQENSLYSNAELKIQRNKVEIIKPLTYMNLSGEAVRKVVGLAKAKEKDLDLASNLMIVHDDVDLEFGQIKIKDSGGDGGHNGIKSIITELNTDKFIRIRLGVGRPSDKRIGTADHVLDDFTKEEWDFMWEDCFPRSKRFIVEYMIFGLQKARSLMSKPINDPKGE